MKAHKEGEPRFAKSIAIKYLLLGHKEEVLATLDEGATRKTSISFFNNDSILGARNAKAGRYGVALADPLTAGLEILNLELATLISPVPSTLSLPK